MGWYMKVIEIAIVTILLTFVVASIALAAPTNNQKADSNPQVIAYYPSGVHAIPTDPVTYVNGTDLVTKRGSTGEIQAWYTSTDGHGVHSVWNLSHDGTCPSHWVLIAQAYPVWGDYLTPGADYCVYNNSF